MDAARPTGRTTLSRTTTPPCSARDRAGMTRAMRTGASASAQTGWRCAGPCRRGRGRRTAPDRHRVAVEGERQEEPDLIARVIAHRKTMKQRVLRQEYRAGDVQQALLQDEAVAVVNVRIGEVDAENRVVVGEVRAQQQRLDAVDQDLEMREISGVEI